jgi:hypothetical protein
VDDEQVEQEISRLYERPLAEFTEARKDLEARLREDGDPHSAERVKRLRKPSLSAWTIDQLSRLNAPELEELIALGKELREAQRRALAGGGGAELQRAGAERRRLVDRLLDSARSVLEEAGHPASRSQLDHVENTLLATATDEALRERVRRGTLEKEAPPPSDFGGLADLEAGAPRPPRAPERAGRSGDGRKPTGHTRAAQQDPRLERARRRAEELERAAGDAESEARRLRQESRAAEARAAKTKVAAERAEANAREARDRAAKARREAE